MCGSVAPRFGVTSRIEQPQLAGPLVSRSVAVPEHDDVGVPFTTEHRQASCPAVDRVHERDPKPVHGDGLRPWQPGADRVVVDVAIHAIQVVGGLLEPVEDGLRHEVTSVQDEVRGRHRLFGPIPQPRLLLAVGVRDDGDHGRRCHPAIVYVPIRAL